LNKKKKPIFKIHNIIIKPDLSVFLAGIPIGKTLKNPLMGYHFISISPLFYYRGMNEVRAPPSSCSVSSRVRVLRRAWPNIVLLELNYIISSASYIIPTQFQRFSDVILPLKLISNITTGTAHLYIYYYTLMSLKYILHRIIIILMSYCSPLDCIYSLVYINIYL